ncbi:M14 family zinc carboxypeptidase [Nannocystaceae bacterium ST9]
MPRLAVLLLVIVSSWIVFACRAPAQTREPGDGEPLHVASRPDVDPSDEGEALPDGGETEAAIAIAAKPTCSLASSEPGDPVDAPMVESESESESESEPTDEPRATTARKPSVSGFPQYDPVREVTLWGKVRPGDPAMVADALRSGTWTEDAGRLAPAAASVDDQLWLPRGDAAQLAEGLVRMRVELKGKLDVSLLLRQTHAGEPPRELSGYDLSITGEVVRLHRWDRGMQLPMGPEAKIELGRRASLEVVVMMVGPQLLANVYDGDTLEHLASAAAHDTTYAWGCVGLRVGEKHDPRAAFTLLSVMDAAPSAARTHQRLPESPRYAVLPPSDQTPFGNTRYAWIRGEDLDALPKSLRRELEAELESPEGEARALLFLDTVEYERLLRSGVEVLAVDSNAPWSAFDPAFRKRATQAPRKQGRGFELADSYKDPALVEQLLRAYHERYPTITSLIEIGRTHQNRPIWALKISDDDAATDLDEPAVLFNAAHHGSELLSIEYVLDAIDQLLAGYHRDPQIDAWVDHLEIWCVPLVNVDGNHMFVHESRFAIRKNAYDGNADGFADPFEGVDLNRNYPFGWGGEGSSDQPMHKWYRGPAPGSEPETQAMMKLADAEHFAAVLSFHTFGTDVYSAYGWVAAKEPKPDVNRAIGELIAAAAPEQPNGQRYAVRKGAYPVAGSDQDWHHHEHGSIAFVIEGSHHNPELDVRTAAVEATRPLWQALLERVHRGPWIGGHVRDASGNPVAASVMVREIQTFEGERWTTRGRDGRFDRAIAKPGKYTLIVEVEGQPAIEREVEVGSRRVDVDIVI